MKFRCFFKVSPDSLLDFLLEFAAFSGTFVKNVKLFKAAGCRCETIPWNRIVLASLITVVNMGFVIAGPLLLPYDFATHLLFILQANLMVYAGFYAVMKITHTDEKISRATCLYFLLATPAWLAGMYYFTQAYVFFNETFEKKNIQ
jgi:dsRNA-gated channel SID-1